MIYSRYNVPLTRIHHKSLTILIQIAFDDIKFKIFCTCDDIKKLSIDDDYLHECFSYFFICTCYYVLPAAQHENKSRIKKRRKDVIRMKKDPFCHFHLKCQVLRVASCCTFERRRRKMFISDSYHVNIADACIKCYLYLSAFTLIDGVFDLLMILMKKEIHRIKKSESISSGEC